MSDTENKVIDENDDLEINVIDDTPEDDRGKPDHSQVDNNIPTDDEIAQYGEGVQKRIRSMTARYNAERRSREKIERENAQAVNIIRQLRGEIERTRGFAKDQFNQANTNAKASIEANLEAAKRDLATAFDTGDSGKFAEANANVARFTAQLERLSETMSRAERIEQEQKKAEEETQGRNDNFGGMNGNARTVQEAANSPDTKAVAWGARNPWFGQNQVMTGAAYGIHAELVERGVDIGSDSYYAEIDTRMREMFPALRGNTNSRTNTKTAAPSHAISAQGRSIAAPASKRSVTLTASEVAIAKKMGITPEQYAREKVKLEGVQ